MNADTLLSSLSLGEETDLEFKSARGGVPGSMWETYSSMANTDGGCILLGVENNGTISGLPDPAKARKTVWDLLNNRGQVSINLLSNDQVRVVPVGEKSVLVMEIPRANRRQRPVYVGQNPIKGTYRRNFEGDYLCDPEEVGRMLADQSEEPLTAGFWNTSASTTSTRRASSNTASGSWPVPPITRGSRWTTVGFSPSSGAGAKTEAPARRA